MKVIDYKITGRAADGVELVRALILSDTTPAELPASTTGMHGVPDGMRFDGFSVIWVLEPADGEPKRYISGTDGVFVAQ